MLPQSKTYPDWVLTLQRCILYAKYVLKVNEHGTTTLKMKTRGTAMKYTLGWFLFHTMVGGNREYLMHEYKFPKYTKTCIRNILNKHFESDEIGERLKHLLTMTRDQFFHSDVALGQDNNNPFRPTYLLEAVTLILVTLCGTRDGSTRELQLGDIHSIRIDRKTGKVSCTIDFTHLKMRGKNVVQPRTFTGYLWLTKGWRTDLIYHLHRLLVFKSQGRFGLVFPKKEDRFEATYGWELELGTTHPSKEQLTEGGSFCTWDDVLNASLEVLSTHFPENEVPDFATSPLLNTKPGQNARLVRKFFAFYPESIRKCLCYHSGRGGAFIQRVWDTMMHGEEISPKAFMNALIEASSLIGWKQKTAPTQWYDKNMILKTLVNYSFEFEPSPYYSETSAQRNTTDSRSVSYKPLASYSAPSDAQRMILQTPRLAHNLEYDPSISDFPELLKAQQQFTGPVVDKMVRITVQKKFAELRELRNENKKLKKRDRSAVIAYKEQVSVEEGIKRVYASFYHRFIKEGFVCDHPYLRYINHKVDEVSGEERFQDLSDFHRPALRAVRHRSKQCHYH
jgi:hypothetical protein